MKKIIVCLILVLSIAFYSDTKAEACPYSGSCMVTTRIAHCGQRYGMPAYNHQYQAANGNIFVCGVTNEQSSHYFTCAGCLATYDYSYNEVRTCNEIHSACGGTRTNLCNAQ